MSTCKECTERRGDVDSAHREMIKLQQELAKWRAYARAAWEVIDHIVRNGNG